VRGNCGEDCVQCADPKGIVRRNGDPLMTGGTGFKNDVAPT